MSEPKNSKSDGNDKKRRIFRAELPTDESIMKKFKNISDSRIGFQDMVESQYDSLTEEDFEKLDEIEKTIIKLKNRLASGMRGLGSEKRNNHWDELDFLRSKAVHGDEKAIRFFINMIEQSWPLAPDSGIHQFAIDTLGESAYMILLTGKDNIENDMIEALSFPLRNWKIREFGFRSAASLGHFINNIDVINLLIEEYINKNNSVQANLNNIFQDTAGNTKYGDQITNIKFRTKILNILNSLISEEDNRSFFREKFIQLLENKDFTELINVDYDLKKIFENEKELEYFLTMETIDSIITTITVSDRFSNLKYEEIRNLYPKITQLLLQTLEKLSSQENDVSRWVSKEIEEITIEILKIMCRIKDSSVVEVIVNIMERNDSWEIKSEAARALGQIGNVEALDPILDIVTTQEEEIIRQKQHIMFKFIESLGNLGDSEITGLLTNWMYYLHDDKYSWPFVKNSPIQALGKIGDESSIMDLLNIYVRHLDLPEIEGKSIAVEEALVSIGEKGRDTYLLYSSEKFFKESYDQSMSDITEEEYNSILEKSNHLINIMCLNVLKSIDIP